MYKLINIGTQANSQIREYIADTEDDIATLPDSDPFGSTVFVIETSATYMKNSAGEYVEIAVFGGGGSAGGGVIEMNCTIQVDSETGKQVITTDVTATEMFDACTAGKRALVDITVPVSEESSIVVRKTISIDGQVLGDDEEAVYEFCFATVDQDTGLIGFLATSIADDIVVFTQV